MKALFRPRAKRFLSGSDLFVVWRQWNVELYRDAADQGLNAARQFGSDGLQPFRVRDDVLIKQIQNGLLDCTDGNSLFVVDIFIHAPSPAGDSTNT